MKPTFTEYAQLWVDSRQIVENISRNYCSMLNNAWGGPHLGTKRIDQISGATCASSRCGGLGVPLLPEELHRASSQYLPVGNG
jgi:hypothetical protein